MKYKFLLVLLPLLFTTSSCNKWLELQPQDGLIRENFWETKEQLKSAVVGIYSSLINPALVQNLFIWGELRADMVSLGLISTVDQVNFNTDQILSTNALTNWSTLYTTINYCNNVIEFGPEVIKKDNTLTTAQLNYYLAEAHGVRALMYFYLLRIWGEVPLQLKASSSDTKIEKLAKSSKTDVYNQIKADLDFAATNAIVSYTDANGNRDDASNKGRINQYTIFAIQADVALWMDKYDECIAACDKIINSQNFGLIDGTVQTNWFNTLYVNGNSNESIFEFQFSNVSQNGWYNTFSVVTRQLNASPLIADFYGVDAVDPLLVDDRAEGGSYRLSDLTVYKMVGTASGSLVGTANSNRHWFVYRYADILLMKAEALAWTNHGQDALDLVNVIRTRAKAVSGTAESPDPNNALAVSDYILRERSREFAFEGKRWFDLLRNAKRNNYAHIDLILDALAKVAPADKQQAILNKFRDTRSHYLPIIITELQADKLLVQNPFYQ